jgi:hypothetical protein
MHHRRDTVTLNRLANHRGVRDLGLDECHTFDGLDVPGYETIQDDDGHAGLA